MVPLVKYPIQCQTYQRLSIRWYSVAGSHKYGKEAAIIMIIHLMQIETFKSTLVDISSWITFGNVIKIFSIIFEIDSPIQNSFRDQTSQSSHFSNEITLKPF